MNGFSLTDSALDDAWVLHVAGEPDASSALLLREYVTAGLIGRPGVAFILDLSAVVPTGSVGLGICTATLRRAAALSHRVAIVAISPSVRHQLARTGISLAYPVHHCLTNALTPVSAVVLPRPRARL